MALVKEYKVPSRKVIEVTESAKNEIAVLSRITREEFIDVADNSKEYTCYHKYNPESKMSCYATITPEKAQEFINEDLKEYADQYNHDRTEILSSFCGVGTTHIFNTKNDK